MKMKQASGLNFIRMAVKYDRALYGQLLCFLKGCIDAD